QAIRLLQLSSLELQNEIQETLDNNPLLEELDNNNDTASDSDDYSLDQSSLDQTQRDESVSNKTDPQELSDIPNDLPVDSNWDDIYPTLSTTHNTPMQNSEDDNYNPGERNAPSETLTDHLLWQLNLTPMSPTDRVIAEAIIEALDENGYLRASLEDILETVTSGDDKDDTSSNAEDPDNHIELDEVGAVLRRIQHFDPPGIAARDLRECLLLQLAQKDNDTPWKAQAFTLISDFLPLIGSHDYPQLMRKLHVTEEQLKGVIQTIQSLNPHPGSSVQYNSTDEYVVPDVIVRKVAGRWSVELNADVVPKLRVNANYAALIQNNRSSEDATYLKNNLQEARWFIKSLVSRNETLLKVSTKIVEHQIGFFEYGEEAMQPLVLRDIAQSVEMHESTISRVTTQKYMHTPHGIFELKYFFSSHVSTASGGECSATAIQAIIRKLIAAENKRKPLSDSQIATVLADKDIQIARRTVAKYRESLNIPPSNERKRLV
ncbi:MAG: RNA polymerase factor sigma-54, partial [Gammaproteobacteria bacterium]